MSNENRYSKSNKTAARGKSADKSHPSNKKHSPQRNSTLNRRRPPLRTDRGDEQDDELDNSLVIGRNAVRELLATGRAVDKILVQRGEREGSIVLLVALARERGIVVSETDKHKLDAMAGFSPHQGIIAMIPAREYVDVEDILKIAESRGEPPFIVISDGICDPYNLGAVIRCAEGAGAHGLIIPKRRASGLTSLVTKASAGAVEHLAVAKVSNIASVIDTLKSRGVWIYGADGEGNNYYETDMASSCAFVFGSEGDGLSRLVREKCDFIVSIPMYGKVTSLNVSTAAAVIFYEAARQRRG